MKNPRVVQAKLVLTCDVLIDNAVVEAISDQYSAPRSDEDAATQLLYAMINPKMQDTSLEGHWDGVCSFTGRFKNLNVTTT
ncbi:hypothetical protein [Paenibacillus radicis (ex Xue et al. 2023)]|uniref:Uncharacterized protein n=1 Tax=Paenibacillus radicis (ex Xue et al. 2023) TaxID=2972489 RepID=A0ABT1YM70_9BACL|nr:hypothetical protein [Paenibacillus radicis (ex Xue et al. 2023)]MCR8633509.1 hypothetical protein [Paenibacillus radicis (ex Xue et al. 2023)]